MISSETSETGPTEANIGLISEDLVPNDLDKVIKLVEEEGRVARNLLTWNVPIDQSQPVFTSSQKATETSVGKQDLRNMKKPPLNPRAHILNHLLGTVDAHSVRPMKRFSSDKTKAYRIRSASAERDPKHDLSARYWAFLFENLQRAVDAIYQTCDAHESVIECKETIMMLENYVKEFTSLIEWLNLNKNYENASPTERPTSLAWEVKKSSLNRSLPLSPTVDKKLSKAIGGSSCRRQLFIASKSEVCTQTEEKMNGSIPLVDAPKKSVPKIQISEASQHQASNKQSSTSNAKANNPSLNSLKPINDQRRTPKVAAKFSPQGKKSSVILGNKMHSPPASKQKSMVTKKPVKSVRDNEDERQSFTAVPKVTKEKVALTSHSSLTSLQLDLNNDQINKSSSSLSSTSSNGRSWADKVRGIAHIPPINESDIAKQELNSHSVDDNDGWETVHRGKNKLRTPPPTRSNSNLKNSSLLAGQSSSNQGSRGGRRKTRHSCESIKDQLNEKQKKGLSSHALSAKSMPVLNRKLRSESRQNSFKKPSSQKRTVCIKANEKAKSLPNVSESLTSSSTDIISPKMESSSLEKEIEAVKHGDASIDDSVPTATHIENTSKVPKHGLSAKDKNEVEIESNSVDLDLTNSVENNSDVELETNVNEDEGEERKVTNWAELVVIHEDEMAAAAWADSSEQPEGRQPGRALQMHEKLSSPSRKRSISETIRRHEEKQAKAQEQRERILEEKAQKLRDQSKKIEEVRAWKEELLLKKKGTMERKLQKAEQKRIKRIQLVVKKARDEEEKVNEIAFINTLEAQNKRLDVLSRQKDHEARLQDIQEERQRRQEEKAAKEAAAEERRKALETERLSRLQEIQEKRKQRDMKIEQQLQEKEKERLELAREKAREREQRLSALTAAQNAVAEELQRKIKIKQEESARRHEENIEQKRQKAFELSVRKYSSNNDDAPRLVPYEMVKMCTLCNVLIFSEVYLLSHLRGKTHQEAVREKNEGKELVLDEMETFNLKLIIDAPADKVDPRIVQDKERQKALKKRCKKIRHRMMQRATEFENVTANKKQQVESQNKAKLARSIKEINKCIQNQGTGVWASNLVSSLERSLGEVSRALDRKLVSDQIAFRVLGGLTNLMKLLNLISAESKDVPLVIPPRTLVLVCNVFERTCVSCRLNCTYVLYSNFITNLVDLTIDKLNPVIASIESPLRSSPTLSDSISYASDSVAGNLMQVVAVVLTCLAQQVEVTDAKDDTDENGFQLRARDVVSYIVSIGLVDKIYEYFKTIQGPIDNDPAVAEFIYQSVMLLTGVVKLLSNKYKNAFGVRKTEDATQLISTLSMTEIVGTVSMLYGMLLHSGAASPECGMPPPQLPQLTTAVAMAVLQLLNHVAILDLDLFQRVLGSEGTSLEFRHISSYLMWYCSHWPDEDLLHELIVLIGHFTVLCNDNQMVLQSGHYPTVLQQLCALPFNYFSDPFLTMILFPTLISCCYCNNDNKEILEQDMSSSLLGNFIEGQEFSLLQADLLPSKTAPIAERWLLQNRFPEEKWNEARDFFNSASP